MVYPITYIYSSEKLEKLSSFAINVLGYHEGGGFDSHMFDQNGRSINTNEVDLDLQKWEMQNGEYKYRADDQI